jgi:pyrophosphatase PpaX
MKFENCQTILFDLDGTVLNSLPGIEASFTYLIETHFPDSDIKMADVLRRVGRPLEELMLELASGDHALADELAKEYRRHNQALLPQLPLFPGALECFNRLRKRGCQLGIVTSKARDSTMISVKTHQLDSYFDLILTKDETTLHKPNPEPLLHAMRQLKAKPTTTAYIGDATFDILAAQAAKCFDVAAIWGSHDPDTLIALNPSYVVRTFAELS